MDLLNLDDILKAKRKITIGGISYDVKDQSIGQMINALQLSKQLEKEGDEGEAIMTKVVESIKEIIPDCPEKVIRSLNMRAVNAIFDFANQSDQALVEKSKAQEDEASTEEKK